MSKPIYYRSMHPKTEISPSLEAIERILNAGWVGQAKINGHRAQIHIHPKKEDVLVYNRMGQLHRIRLPDEMAKELRRILPLDEDWTILDAEWIKPERKLFLFDMIKLNGALLRDLSYGQRYALLPRDYISPYIRTLPLLRSPDKCVEMLRHPSKNIEGLVFKSLTAKGFSDTAIVRCRKQQKRY